MTRLTIICISFIIVSFIFTGDSYAKVDPDTILGAWLLDEGTGDIAADATGNGNDGTLMNAPNWVAGWSGTALEFDGASTYVDCGNDETLNTGVFSVSFWCNIPTTQGWNHMVSRGSHLGWGTPGSVNWGVMMFADQETILFETFNDTRWSGITADTTTGQWHHIVATYDGNLRQLY
ncbi:MAG: LamG-like jellyroll fold domain-containing protein, partial [Planctomycetota bacterium]